MVLCLYFSIFLFQFKEGEIRPVHDDILIAKLRPGQVKLMYNVTCDLSLYSQHTFWCERLYIETLFLDMIIWY
jgi:hypothetical protein